MDDTSTRENDGSNPYQVKEDVLLENFLHEIRRDKAKVLRSQQLKNYEEYAVENALTITRKKPDDFRKVKFVSASLIQDAIKEGNKYEVLDLLSNGVSVNFNGTQGEGMSLLHQACVYDDYIIAESLIKQGASVNMPDDYHCTPLHICCLWDSMKCAQLLLSNHALTNILDLDNNFAIDLAADNSHMKAMMKKHMQQKLKIDESQLNNLRNKTQKAMLQEIRSKLEQGDSVDHPGANGITLLHVAVTNGYLSAARMLLENSANVNVADTHLWTPLHCAAKYKQVKMVKLLLSHYANPHARSIANLTPRDMTRDQAILKMLFDAEESFLDLDNQKTPAKTKRFSASLLDQSDGEELTRVQTRVISSTRMAKRDVSKEIDVLTAFRPKFIKDLKGKVQLPIGAAHSYDTGSLYNLPPPLPPRDDGTQPPQPTPTSLPVKPVYYQTTNLHGEKLLKAVVTIQRAVRKHILDPDEKLRRMLRNIEDCGSLFYDEVVLQNADDIARENDRQRALKSLQRNSWGPEAPRQSFRAAKQERPLSTGYLMSYAQDSSSVWIPQAPGAHQGPMAHQHGYPHHQQMPPDVVPYYSGPTRSWSTMPHRGVHGKPMQKSNSSIDSGLSMDSKQSDFTDLSVNVKRSLTMKEPPRRSATSPSVDESVPVRLRKSSLGALRPSSNYTTYKMPPLTPTVATLIHHTTSVVQDQPTEQSPPKVMQPVTIDENQPYEHGTFPRHHRFHSLKTPLREHRYGSMLSDRGRILRDNRLAIGTSSEHGSPTPSRHSWDCPKQMAPNDLSLPPPPVHPIVSPPPAFENKRFSDEMSTSFAASPTTPSGEPRPYIDVTLPRRKSGHAPPPPPPRDPKTRLSESSGSLQQKAERPASLNARNSYENHTLPSRRLTRQSNTDSDDDLPPIPPPLPLYTPQVVIDKRASQAFPPPPDELLSPDVPPPPQDENEDDSFAFPPPPPTL